MVTMEANDVKGTTDCHNEDWLIGKDRHNEGANGGCTYHMDRCPQIRNQDDLGARKVCVLHVQENLFKDCGFFHALFSNGVTAIWII